MAKTTKQTEQTTIALMGQDLGYIKKSIENMETSLKSIDSNFVKKEDLKDLKPAICTTIGYLYEDNDNYIIPS